MIESSIANAFDDLWAKSSERNWIYGRLGRPNGSGFLYDVPGQPGYKYVMKGSEGAEGLVTAIDRIGVAPVANQRVKMRREYGHLVIREAEQLAGGGGGGGGSNTLAGLYDVSLTSLADGNMLQYSASASRWVNIIPAGGSGALNLNALTDVTLTATANGQTLVYNSSAAQWLNDLLPWNSINFAGSSLANIATRPHSALTGIGPDDHHAQHHSIIGTDHTVVGADFTVVGVHPANTVALLPTSSNPGATQSVLRTDTTGGLQLDTNLLSVDAVNNRIGVNVTPGAGPLGGAAALDIRAAATGDITQRIRQIAGQTQRLWRVEDVAGNELIIMDSVGNLQSGMPGFVSGLSGWQITPAGNAEFNNIWARGELHATVFVKDEVHATGGTFFVATAGTLHDDATIDNSTPTLENFQVTHKPGSSQITDDLTIETTSSTFSGTTLSFQALINFININDPPSGPAFYFNSGDTIRSKTEVPTGVTDFWLTVNGAQQMTGYARYSVYKRSGTNGVLPKGSAVVSYGQVGAGRILMTSDLNFAPYLDVFTVGPNVWTGAAGSVIPRLRLGRLDGVGVPGVSGVEQYGMVAGTDLTNANAPYFIASNLQFKLYKINITLNNGSNDTASLTQDGNLTLGSNIGVTAGKSFQAFATASGSFNAGDVLIGQAAGNYLKWDQSAGLLTINGSLQVGGADAKSYIDNQDSATYNNAVAAAATDATTKANNAQGNAVAYGDHYKLLGMGGSMTVTGQRSMAWTGITLYYADGVVQTLSDASPIGLNATLTTYIYSAYGSGFALTTTTLTTMPLLSSLLAVFDPGATTSDPGSLSIVAGSTYISGNNIVTGSIIASNIQANAITTAALSAGAVTAAKISVATLSAIQIMTGNLTVSGNLVMGTSGSNFGALYSFGKVDFTNNTAGYFMGWDTNGGASAYKFRIGDANNFLQWNGTQLGIKTNTAIQLVVPSSVQAAITFIEPGGHVGNFYFSWDSTNSRSILHYDGLILADAALQTPQLILNSSVGGNMIQFLYNAHTHNLSYDSTGILSYDGDFYALSTLRTTSTTSSIICGGSRINIATISPIVFTGSTSSPAGTVGDIVWQAGFIYVYVGGGNGWRRATLNSF